MSASHAGGKRRNDVEKHAAGITVMWEKKKRTRPFGATNKPPRLIQAPLWKAILFKEAKSGSAYAAYTKKGGHPYETTSLIRMFRLLENTRAC